MEFWLHSHWHTKNYKASVEVKPPTFSFMVTHIHNRMASENTAMMQYEPEVTSFTHQLIN